MSDFLDPATNPNIDADTDTDIEATVARAKALKSLALELRDERNDHDNKLTGAMLTQLVTILASDRMSLKDAHLYLKSKYSTPALVIESDGETYEMTLMLVRREQDIEDVNVTAERLYKYGRRPVRDREW